MRTVSLIVLIIAVILLVPFVRRVYAADVLAPSTTQPTQGSPLSFSVKDVDGKDVNLADYKGKVVMIVNVASKCGYTKQYTALESVYTKYKDQGFVILGFPANSFRQEPGTDEEIKAFCSGKYNVTFPIMSKMSVKGDDQSPLYKYLTDSETDGNFGGPITWNFNKFLVGRDGKVIARFGSPTKPDDAKVIALIEKSLTMTAMQ